MSLPFPHFQPTSRTFDILDRLLHAHFLARRLLRGTRDTVLAEVAEIANGHNGRLYGEKTASCVSTVSRAAAICEGDSYCRIAANPTTTQLRMQLVPVQEFKFALRTMNATAAQKTTSRLLRMALAFGLAHLLSFSTWQVRSW